MGVLALSQVRGRALEAVPAQVYLFALVRDVRGARVAEVELRQRLLGRVELAQAQLGLRLSVPRSTSRLEFTRLIGRMRSRGKWMAVPCLDRTQITSTRLRPCA